MPLPEGDAVTGTARPAPRGTRWSVVAPVSCAIAWLGVFSFSSLTLLAVPAALLALVAGTLGLLRDRRTLWRVVAGLSVGATLALIGVAGLIVFLLSAGRPVP